MKSRTRKAIEDRMDGNIPLIGPPCSGHNEPTILRLIQTRYEFD